VNQKISAEWTNEERLWVVREIGQRMQELANGGQHLSVGKTFDYGERLYFLAVKSSTFLESGRQQILSGLGGIYV
jgi:hypothetical protein